MKNKQDQKIELLQTEYAKAQFAKFENERRQVVYRRRRLTAVFLVSLLIFAFVGLQMFNDQVRLQKLQSYKEETLTDKEEAEKNVTQLKREVALLQDDDYVAKLARSRLFYSKEDETIYPVLPDSKNSETTSSESSSDSEE